MIASATSSTAPLSSSFATAEDITQIYVAAFLRPPELGGFSYWMGEAQSGKSAEQIAAIIFSLDVVKVIYPSSMNSAAFVTAIYQNVFSKVPNSEGLNYWSAQLEGGLDRGALALSMIRSGLKTPDGTPGKAMIVNRMDVARYAVARQQATGIEVTPANLKLNFAMVSGGISSVELARANIDVLVSISPQQAARFLLQAGFNASDSDIAAIQATNYSTWLDQEFNRPVGETSWDWATHEYAATREKYNFESAIGWRLISSPDALRQRVAFALSEFFVVGEDGLDVSFPNFMLAAWWDLLCEHTFGNYRAMLGAITLSLPMGYYLNMLGNKKENPATGRMPDENYAREIMQLFSIGLYQLNLDGTPLFNGSGQPIETYTQSDVSNLARVFTGWTRSSSIPTSDPNYARQPMVFRSADHSTLNATFLGVTVSNADGLVALERALDVIFMHPNVGPFFGKHLIQRLVTSNPSPAYISRVAAAFNNNGSGVRGDMKAVIRAVLLDEEARTDANLQSPSFGKLREPYLRYVQWARTFRVSSLDGHWRMYNLGQGRLLNQQALDSPSVFNFFRPGYIPPNSVIAQQRLVAPEFQIIDEVSTANYLNTMQNFIAYGTGYLNGYPNQLPGAKPNLQPDYSVELTLAANASVLLKHLNLKLCAGQMSAETELTIRDAINTIAIRSDTPANNETDLKKRIHAAIFLTMACPDYLIQK